MTSPYFGDGRQVKNFGYSLRYINRFYKVGRWEREGKKCLKNVGRHLWMAPYLTKNVKAIKTMLLAFKFCSMERKVSK